MLQGRRVVLRPIERADLATYTPWFNDPEVLEYFGRYWPMTLADEENWYEGQLGDPSRVNFAVEADGVHIGGCGFANIDHRNRHAEAGLFIGEKSYWNQGFGQDILRTLVDYGFHYLNFHRIYLRVFADNARGVRAYEKVGFRHEGRFRDAEWRHGRWMDILFMSILSHEWQPDAKSSEVEG
ncbi:MAG: GNAT family N-acetyltransferase [Caldilineales bacterium]|nr:GNAT family N-acetyltransferase [Caldilineales bacterium]